MNWFQQNFSRYSIILDINPPLILGHPDLLKVEYAYVGALIAAAIAFYVPFVHFSLRIPGVNKIYRSDDIFKIKY